MSAEAMQSLVNATRAAPIVVIEGSWTVVKSTGVASVAPVRGELVSVLRNGGKPDATGTTHEPHAGTLSLLRHPQAVALLLAATLTILSNTIISPGLPGIRAAFESNSRADLLVPLLVTAPSLLVAILAPFAGALADRFGPRRQLLAGAALFALAGTAGLWLDSLEALLVSRLVLGVAVALIITAQTAFIGHQFTGPARTSFLGLQIAASNLSGFAFMLGAGLLAAMSPFLPFAIYAIALLYLPLMWSALKEPDRSKTEVQTVRHEGEAGWHATLAVATLLALLSLIAFYLVPTQVPFYLAQLGHADPSASAMVLASVTLAGGLFSLAYGRVRERFGRSMTLALGFAFLAAGFGALSLANGLLPALGAGLLIGGATGLLFPTFLSIAIDVAPSGRHGVASGTITTAIFLGQFLSPLAGRPLIEAVGYAQTFALTAALCVAFGLTALLTFRTKTGRT